VAVTSLFSAACGTTISSAVALPSAHTAHHWEALGDRAVRPFGDLCTVPAINNYVVRVIGTPPAPDWNCADDRTPQSGLVDTTWGEFSASNHSYAAVTVIADSAAGHGYFAYDHSLVSKKRYRGSPFYISELPNIDGNAAIWMYKSMLETEFHGDEVSVTVYIPTDQRREKSVAIALATLVLKKGFH
jgi:hypothetical protein